MARRFACLAPADLSHHWALHIIAAVVVVSDQNLSVHRLSAVGVSLLPAGMQGVAREVQRCPPGVHRVHSPKRYASEDSEGRPAAILSYQYQSRVNGMFPRALTDAGLCAICHSKSDGIVWRPSGPVRCTSCGYEYSNPSERDSSVSLDNSDVPSGILVSSDACSDDEQNEEVASVDERSVFNSGITASGGNAPGRGWSADQEGMSGTLTASSRTVWFSIPAGEGNAVACGDLASGGNAPARELTSGGNASAGERSVEVSEPHRRQRRSPLCGSRAMGGVDFDGSPISETDEEDRNHDHVHVAIGYHEIWDQDDPPLEHEVVDRSSIPPGYRFASSLTREELRVRYQFRGNWFSFQSADAEFAYVQRDIDPDLLYERTREPLASRARALPPDTSDTPDSSDNESEAAVPERQEFWPNGNPMWATGPTTALSNLGCLLSLTQIECSLALLTLLRRCRTSLQWLI